jgi:uncharacterized UPF0160 family protein
MLKLTKDINEANLVTHGGTFHPDDVFSTVLMSKIVDNPVVYRANASTATYPDKLLYDIGFGEFDHHGPDALMRNPKIKYSSFGLLWKRFGKEYLTKITTDVDEMWTAIDERLVMQIDGIDNGNFPKITADYSLLDLDAIIDLFNRGWDEKVDNDEQFIQAVIIAETIFDRLIVKEQAKINAKKKVVEKIKSTTGEILILDEYMPYHEALFDKNIPEAEHIKIIVFPSNREGYNVKPKTISKDSKELLIKFPKELLGLHDEELANITHIPTARFVHTEGFIGATDTLEDAIKLAELALNNKE